MKKNINIIIMGPQGSGKGTQARMLAEKYDLQVFETGDILRNVAKQDTDIGRIVDNEINKKGGYASWEILEKVLNQKIGEFDKNKGIIFDGTPRRMEEIRYWENALPILNRKIDYVFYVDISKEESVKRLSVRKQCRKNRHLLIVGKDLKEEDAKCPICGSEVYRREDDTPEKILNRLEWSKKLLSPVIEYYKKKNMLIKINGEQSVGKVFEEIVDYVK